MPLTGGEGGLVGAGRSVVSQGAHGTVLVVQPDGVQRAQLLGLDHLEASGRARVVKRHAGGRGGEGTVDVPQALHLQGRQTEWSEAEREPGPILQEK